MTFHADPSKVGVTRGIDAVRGLRLVTRIRACGDLGPAEAGHYVRDVLRPRAADRPVAPAPTAKRPARGAPAQFRRGPTLAFRVRTRHTPKRCVRAGSG